MISERAESRRTERTTGGQPELKNVSGVEHFWEFFAIDLEQKSVGPVYASLMRRQDQAKELSFAAFIRIL